MCETDRDYTGWVKRPFKRESGPLPPQRRRARAVQGFERVRGEQPGRRAQLPAPVAVQEQQAVAVAGGPVGVVQGQRHAAAGVGLAARPGQQPGLMRRVEMGQRLVEQRDARRLHRQLRQPRALALAAGQGGERAAGEVGQFPAGEVRRQIGQRSPERKMPERDEVGHAAEKSALVALRQQADVLRAGQRRQGGNRLAVERDAAVHRDGEPRQHRQQRRLAGAVGAEDAQHLAGFKREIERIDQRAGAGLQRELNRGQSGSNEFHETKAAGNESEHSSPAAWAAWWAVLRIVWAG